MSSDIERVLKKDSVVRHDVECIVGPPLLPVEHVVLGAHKPSARRGEYHGEPMKNS